jgi:hypothetical protein
MIKATINPTAKIGTIEPPDRRGIAAAIGFSALLISVPQAGFNIQSRSFPDETFPLCRIGI